MNYLKLFGIAAFAIAVILYMASAEEHKVVMGDQDFDLGDFTKIRADISADLNIRADQPYALNVRADENDLKRLKIYVKGQTLVIENKRAVFNSWKGERPVITIGLPLLKKMTINGNSDAVINSVHGSFFKLGLNGSGSVVFDGASEELKVEINGSGDASSTSFDAKENEVEINGSGTIALVGDCENLEIEINGAGDFQGQNFKCSRVEIDILGSGDVDIFAVDSLEVEVIGSGDVNVYGNPKKVTDHSSKKNHIMIR